MNLIKMEMVPDTDAELKELLDWMFANQPNMIQNFIYLDEKTNEFTVSYIMVTTKSKNVYYIEVSDELNKDIKPLEAIESSSKIKQLQQANLLYLLLLWILLRQL